MLLHPDPGLAEVPGLTREQLDALARSVELRRQQLEHDIDEYIRLRQHELRTYEQELLAQHRSMECVEDPESVHANSGRPPASSNASENGLSTDHEHTTSPSPSPSAAKRTKHTRVQKREKELYGLVTPVFLPLLDARDQQHQPQRTPKIKSQNEPNAQASEHATPVGDVDRAKDGRKPRKERDTDDADMEGATLAPVKEQEPTKKSKRSPIKKSSLRQHTTHNTAARSRRKRVSLVIDGQTVLPADTVTSPTLLSPSSETTSMSNSTASLDDMIDPRLSQPPPPHQDAVHHSLPLPMSNNTHAPTKPLVETPSSLPPLAPFSPPKPDPNLKITAPTTKILAPSSTPAPPDQPLPPTIDDADEEDAFSTYVGGLRGSGADNVDQAGSYGYPSSLGASYLESYMQSRPLRVRMEAADKAGLDEREKRELVAEEGGSEDEGGRGDGQDGEGEEMDVLGEMDMDGF